MVFKVLFLLHFHKIFLASKLCHIIESKTTLRGNNMNNLKETATARLILDTNPKQKDVVFILSGKDFDYTDRICKETEKAICYHGHAERLNGDRFGYNMWIPKSILKKEDREFKNEAGETNVIYCLVVPSWFYNQFVHRNNMINFD